MSKRAARSPISLSTKKVKSAPDDVWGDELDENLIEDCFIRASQVGQSEEKEIDTQCNVSVLPSYSFFQCPNNLFSSTQIKQNVPVQDRFKEAQEKYAEKEGEVAILRTNLQKLRTTHQEEQEKKEKEWKEKILATQKNVKAYKSELEFKNLEIVNLKQQINDLSRLVNITEQNSPQKKASESQNIVTFPTPSLITSDSNFRIYNNFINQYPLKELDFPYLFKVNVNEKLIQSKHRNELSVELHTVFPEINHLIGLTEIQLDSRLATSAVNKILCVTLHLLNVFYNNLKKLENTIQLQDIQEADCLYLQNSSDKHLQEFGVDVGKLLGFLSEVLLFNSFIRAYLNKEKCLEKLTDLNATLLQDSHLLDLLLNVISIIGKIRMENVSSEFLSYVFSFISRIFICGKSFEAYRINNVVYEIADQLLFLRLSSHIIPKLTQFMKIASINAQFVKSLCVGKIQKLNGPIDNVLYFKNDSCRFHMFAVLLGNSIKNGDTLKEQTDLGKDIMELTCNLIKSNAPWLYYTDIKKCSCLSQLYKMVIGTIYRDLQYYRNHKTKEKAQNIISGRYVQMLHILCSNSVELTQKYITELAKFKEIIHILSEVYQGLDAQIDDLKVLDGLNSPEEFSDIPLTEFQDVDL